MTRAGFWNDSFDCLYDSSDNFKSFKKAFKEFQESYKRATWELKEGFKKAQKSAIGPESVQVYVRESLRECKRVRQEGVLGGVAFKAIVVLVI